MLMLKKTIAALSLLSILAACQNDENPSQRIDRVFRIG